MGEMADELLEYMETRMIYNDDFNFEDEEDIDFYIDNTKTCKFCQETGLHWRKANIGWRLFNQDDMHKCTIVDVKPVSGKPAKDYKKYELDIQGD